MEVTQNALTFMVLSQLSFVSTPECPLFLLNAVQRIAHSPLAVRTAAGENNDQKSPVHVLHKEVEHFLKGAKDITLVLSKA